MELPSQEAIREWVRNSQGLGCLPYMAIDQALKNQHLAPITSGLPLERQLSWVVPEGFHSAILREFISILAE